MINAFGFALFVCCLLLQYTHAQQINDDVLNLIKSIDNEFNITKINVSPFVILHIQNYINNIKYNNKEFYEKESEFFNMIKAKINIFQEFDNSISQIYIVQDIIHDIYEKISSSISEEDKEHLNEIVSYVIEYMINNQEKIQTMIVKSVVDNDNNNNGNIQRNELPISNLTSIKQINLQLVDRHMVVIVIILVSCLTLIGVYLITKYNQSNIDNYESVYDGKSVIKEEDKDSFSNEKCSVNDETQPVIIV